MTTIDMRPAAVNTYRLLLVATAEARTPCQADPGRFISEEVEDRREAAQACVGCPVLTLCAQFADLNRETSNVWGGRDRTPRPKRPNGGASC